MVKLTRPLSELQEKYIENSSNSYQAKAEMIAPIKL